MLKVRDGAASSKRYADNAANAAPTYKAQVAAAGEDWLKAAASSEDNYNAGVTQAISRKAFKKGIEAAGADHYTSRAVTLGADRFISGVRAGQKAHEEGSRPFLEALSRANLSARGPRGDARNFQRAQEVASLMRRVKTGEAVS